MFPDIVSQAVEVHSDCRPGTEESFLCLQWEDDRRKEVLLRGRDICQGYNRSASLERSDTGSRMHSAYTR